MVHIMMIGIGEGTIVLIVMSKTILMSKTIVMSKTVQHEAV